MHMYTCTANVYNNMWTKYGKLLCIAELIAVNSRVCALVYHMQACSIHAMSSLPLYLPILSEIKYNNNIIIATGI